MPDIISAEHGEILEQPQASETFKKLPEPKKIIPEGTDFNKVKKWQQRIAVARKIREEKLKDLKLLMDYYEGIQWHLNDNMTILKDKTTVNLIFSNIKKELPYLYFQNPTPIVNAKRGEFEFNAFAQQELLKYYTRFNLNTEFKRHVRLAILDAKFSFGILKVSYTPKFSINPNANKPVIAGYDDFNNPIFIIDSETGNVLFEPNETLVSELYYVERCSPREILIDAECRNFPERAKWIGHEIVKPLKYLKDNDLYKNTENLSRNVDLSDLFRTTLQKTSEEIQAAKELYGEDTEKVKFVEIYDFENQELLVLPDNTHWFIREENIFLNPFSFLKFNEKPDEFYPIPDVRIEKPLQQEVNIGRSLMITHARRSARKYYYSEDTFRGIDDTEGIEAAKNPDDMTFFKIADYDKPPEPLKLAVQDPTIFQNLIQSRTDYNEVTSSTEMQRGVTERRKTKGEAFFQEHHAAVRRGDKQSLVADFIVDTYTNLGKLMQHTLTIPQAIQVIGKAGIFWSQVARKDIQGEFFYEIDVSELRPQIPELDRRELSEFIFALSNFMNAVAINPILIQIFNIKGLIGEFAKSYPSINVENILNVNVTPEKIADLVWQQIQTGNTENKNNMNINKREEED